MFRQRIIRGFTLIEITILVALVACVIIGAKFGERIVGSWYGYLLGGALGGLAFFVCMFALAAVVDLWWGGGSMPKCRNGCCRGPGFLPGNDGDYEIQESGKEYYKVCKCGDRYLRRGRRFILVNEDDTEIPYLIWRRFKGWSSDEGQK